jgi:cell division protein FtsW
VVLGILANLVGQRAGTAQSRIKSFFVEKEIPYQAQQSYIAIARGGLFGVGPGNSHQKNLLPHPYNDFIFAIIIEEYGLAGGLLVIFLFLTLLYRGLVTVSNSKNPFGGLLAAGLSFSIAIQAIINMAVAVGLFPITGQPLPWVSMGGTSLLFTGITFGVILSVSRGDNEAVSESKSIRNVVKRTAA